MPSVYNLSKTTDTENAFATTQLVVFFVILLLAIDSINPVKIILHVFTFLKPWHIGTLSLILILYIFISEFKQLLYKGTKIFFNSVLSIFFRDVSLVGTQNIPLYGPVIFTSNHANQFIDSVVLFATCQRKVSFLVAAKSWHRRIVGDIAWAMDSVPVKRAQDSAKAGKGMIGLMKATGEDLVCTDNGSGGGGGGDDSSEMKKEKLYYKVIGTKTKFTSQLKQDDKIKIPNNSIGFKVVTVHDDESMIVDGSDMIGTNDQEFDSKLDPSKTTTFDIFEKMDQSEVYDFVLSKLASGGSIGIFPEGGSHDRTDLLPLKAGVALIAFSALEKDGVNVPIVPVGLNYFRGHRFRGRCIVEFGRPTYVDPNALSDYKKGGVDRRKVCTEFLKTVEDNMRGVIVSTPDYESLQLIHTARRLYRQRFSSLSEKQDLSRRFAEGYKKLLLSTNGKPVPKEWLELQERLRKYQKELNELGLRDYQVPGLSSEKNETDGDFVLREMRLPFRIAELLLLFTVSLIPALLMNLPVGLFARLYANGRRKKALAASKVKIKGLDVMLSEKILLCIVMVPSLWILYGVLLYSFTDFDGPTIALAIFSLPVFSYMGIVVAEAGMIDLKDLRPHLMRLFPSTKKRLQALPEVRRELQQELRDFIRKIGPQLGELYGQKEVDWAQFQQDSRSKLNEKEE